MSMAEAAVAERSHIVLPVEGMTCATCAGRVEKALTAVCTEKLNPHVVAMKSAKDRI